MDVSLKQTLHFILANSTRILPYTNRGGKGTPDDHHSRTGDFKTPCLPSPGCDMTRRFLPQTSSVAQAFALQLLWQLYWIYHPDTEAIKS